MERFKALLGEFGYDMAGIVFVPDAKGEWVKFEDVEPFDLLKRHVRALQEAAVTREEWLKRAEAENETLKARIRELSARVEDLEASIEQFRLVYSEAEDWEEALAAFAARDLPTDATTSVMEDEES